MGYDWYCSNNNRYFFMMIEKKDIKRRAEREKKKSLVAICNRIRCICKPYFYPWKNWYFRSRINLGTAIRTGVVLIMAWIMVMITGKMRTIKRYQKELAFIVLSGLATGSSWLCYYKAFARWTCKCCSPLLIS